MPILTAQEWETFLSQYPNAHVLQMAAWGDLKEPFGWRPVRVQSGNAGAQILFRQLPLGLTIAYIPKGPVGTALDQLWPEVFRVCQANRAIFLKIEPDAWEGELAWNGRLLPSKPIQPFRTIEIDLNGTEEQWLERMKQKCRYNIRLAQKKEVNVRPSSDLDAFVRLMEVTGGRDDFGVHSAAYYRRAYERFHPAGHCELLVAEYQQKPLAALMVFARGSRAWYFYGASSDEERNRMPTYLLQFEAMRWAAARDCTTYDLWGVPDEDEPVLEAQFDTRSDGLWGVYRFKRGFGGMIKRSAGAYDYVFQPLLYRLYRWYIAKRNSEE